MRNSSQSNVLSALTRIALAFVFTVGQTAWAWQSQSTKDKRSASADAKPKQANASQAPTAAAKAQPAEEETAETEKHSPQEDSTGGGRHEGIKVHGHWTIEVRNPDGLLATHREFENSFTGSGAFILASILAGTATSGPWEVWLGSSIFSGPSPWLSAGAGNDPFNSDGGAVIVPSTLAPFAPPGTSFFPNLTVSNSGGQVVLTGSAIPAQNGGIGEVFTYIGYCGNSTSPLSCVQASPNFREFTAVVLQPNQVVQVTAGQTVAVTVNISFSY